MVPLQSVFFGVGKKKCTQVVSGCQVPLAAVPWGDLWPLWPLLVSGGERRTCVKRAAIVWTLFGWGRHRLLVGEPPRGPTTANQEPCASSIHPTTPGEQVPRTFGGSWPCRHVCLVARCKGSLCKHIRTALARQCFVVISVKKKKCEKLGC